MTSTTVRRTLRRWSGRTAVAAAATVLVANAVPVPPALADSPVIQTWWTVNNVTIDSPLPPEVLAPGAIPPVTIPANDVPDGGSEVAGTTDSPTGALTLRYEFPEGSSFGPLVLTVADDVPPAPATELIACPLTGDGRFDTHPGGGPIGELPESDCTAGVRGVLDEGNGTFRFEGIGSLAASEHLSVAVLPVAGRAVLQRALSDSLEITSPEFRSPVAPSPPAPRAAAPAVTPPSFLGQVRTPPPVRPAAPAPVPVTSAPVTSAQPVAERFVTVFRSSAAGSPAGSAVAGLVVLLVAGSSVWRRGRTELLRSTPAT